MHRQAKRAGLPAHTANDLLICEEHLQETIQKSKAAFYRAEADGCLSRAEFIYSQSRYIHKRWWAMQALVLLILWMLLDTAGSGAFVRRCMGIAAPLFALLLLPELWKNKNAGSMEIEGCALYSLRQVYAARMLLFALVDTLLFTTFSAAALASGKLSAGELITDFFLPCVITCCISFRTLYSRRIGSETFALVLNLIFCFLWTQLVLNERIYTAITRPAWLAAAAAAVFYLGFCIYRGQKDLKKGLEVHPLWN